VIVQGIGGTLDIPTSKQVMNGTMGPKSMLNMAVFADYVPGPPSNGKFTMEYWGITFKQALSVGAYLLGYEPFALPYIEKVYSVVWCVVVWLVVAQLY
jgi:hypothetical protein